MRLISGALFLPVPLCGYGLVRLKALMPENVAIIDYGSGNLRSVEKAFARAAHERSIEAAIFQTDDPAEIARADRVVLPGVGAFAACMAGLSARKGVLEALEHAVLVEGRPFLGICVGMQLLAQKGAEFGAHDGLGWMSGTVARLAGATPDLRIPHMGWNAISMRVDHPVFDRCDGEAFYFAHSFHLTEENDAHLVAVTEYGNCVTAAVARDNMVGVQFHPEKSQHAGLTLIGNFLSWTPA